MSFNTVPIDIKFQFLEYLDDYDLSRLKGASREWNASVTGLFNSRMQELYNCNEHMDAAWYKTMEKPIDIKAIQPIPLSTSAFLVKRQHSMAEALINSRFGIHIICLMLNSCKNDNEKYILKIIDLFAAHVKFIPGANRIDVSLDVKDLGRMLVDICRKSLGLSGQRDSDTFRLFQNVITISERRRLLPKLDRYISECLGLPVDLRYRQKLLESLTPYPYSEVPFRREARQNVFPTLDAP